METTEFFDRAPLSEREAMLVSPLRLAYVGDAVHSLFVRTELVLRGGKARAMHKSAVGSVNAAAQAAALEQVESLLTQTEADIVRRGRNAHAHHAAPRSATRAEYARATGLEALFGFLYLTGQVQRLQTIYEAMRASQEETPCLPVP